MAEGKLSLPVVRGAGVTSRVDMWWAQPLVVVLVFGSFIVYSTWAAFQNDHYTYGPYLSPMYSPALFYGPKEQGAFAEKSRAHAPALETPTRGEEQQHHTWFAIKPPLWPDWLIFSPALLILPFPGLFRFTCYYYRGAYYKAFWGDPPNCAVGEPRKSYWGEQYWPLLIQNAHRYALYAALIFIVILTYDAIMGFIFTDAEGKKHLWIGVGSFVLVLNVILLGGYTFGCHSFRHLVGGHKDELANSPTQKKAYDCVSCLNRAHMAWAWCSLFWVAFTDIYVRMCSMGIWTDYHHVF
jgi:hypothetical protein